MLVARPGYLGDILSQLVQLQKLYNHIDSGLMVIQTVDSCQVSNVEIIAQVIWLVLWEHPLILLTWRLSFSRLKNPTRCLGSLSEFLTSITIKKTESSATMSLHIIL